MPSAYLTTQLGILKITADINGISEAKFTNIKEHNNIPIECKQAHTQLSEYFSQKRKNFTLKLNQEATVFQQKVYQALEEIPYGQTKNYTQIAEHINNPKAVRAVGGANNKNSLAIIIPCTE
jgi:methylated-DNA-[protein]-cysteine S-methyltransferase